MSPRITALMKSPTIEPLIERLKSYLSDETEKTDFLIDGDVLSDIVLIAGMVYDGTRLLAEVGSQNTFHELAALLPPVMERLARDANYSDVLVALGAPVMLDLSPDQAAVRHAVERHEALLLALDDIARAVPPALKPGPGRPSKTGDLRAAVEVLVDFWERQTGVPVKHTGHKKEDLRKEWPPAKKFIFEVIQFIDFQRLGELPGVLEKIVTDRRAVTTSVN